MDMIRAVARECGKHNCKVVFYSTLSDFYNHDLTDMGEKKIFDAVSVERYDAVVLMAESFKQDEDYLRMVKKAQEAGVPVVSVDKELTGCINIHFDYKSVFREIVEHMIEYHGYRKVNFIAGFRNNTFQTIVLQFTGRCWNETAFRMTRSGFITVNSGVIRPCRPWRRWEKGFR